MATVDVLVPTYNRLAMLPQCLESRQAQTYTDIRVIIGDDCSGDDTRTVAQDFCGMDGRFHYVRNAARLGIFGNTNTLFTRATRIRGESMGERGRTHARDLCALGSYVDRLPAIYKELLR